MDIKKIIKRYSKGAKIRLKKTEYGEIWQDQRYVEEYYDKMYDERPIITEFIKKYIKEKNPETTLEVGCGAGIFPIRFKELFTHYTAVDIGKPAVEYCKKNSKFEFLEGDFIKMDLGRKFDLVFSQAVIDHVYDPDAFLTNIVKHSKKYVLVCAYRGYHPDLKEHNLEWSNHMGCFHNELAVTQISETLIKAGLSEKQFSIVKRPNGRNSKEDIKNYDTVIEIEL